MESCKFFKTAVVTLIAMSSLAVGTPTTTADAASWHRGAPKALIGRYKRGKNSGLNVTWMRLNVKKGSYELDVHDMPGQLVKHISYRKTGRYTYKLRGTGVKSGFYLGGKSSLTIKKVGHNVKVGKLIFHRY